MKHYYKPAATIMAIAGFTIIFASMAWVLDSVLPMVIGLGTILMISGMIKCNILSGVVGYTIIFASIAWATGSLILLIAAWGLLLIIGSAIIWTVT